MVSKNSPLFVSSPCSSLSFCSVSSFLLFLQYTLPSLSAPLCCSFTILSFPPFLLFIVFPLCCSFNVHFLPFHFPSFILCLPSYLLSVIFVSPVPSPPSLPFSRPSVPLRLPLLPLTTRLNSHHTALLSFTMHVPSFLSTQRIISVSPPNLPFLPPVRPSPAPSPPTHHLPSASAVCRSAGPQSRRTSCSGRPPRRLLEARCLWGRSGEG